jgi:hypothetical protein
MATGADETSVHEAVTVRKRSRRKWLPFVLGAAVLALMAGVAAAWLGWAAMGPEARTATAIAAPTACACRHVSRLPLEQCEAALAAQDLGRPGEHLSLTEDAGAKTVTASVPLLASQSAQFEIEWGCRLAPWDE